ncbi:MAG: fibronectin type III domain-containing protein, partial [Phycisphaerae bacterium]
MLRSMYRIFRTLSAREVFKVISPRRGWVQACLLVSCVGTAAYALPPRPPIGGDDGGGVIIPDVPETPTPPSAPGFPQRADTSLRVRFTDNSFDEDGFRIQTLRGGTWQTVASLGAQGGGPVERVIGGLLPDTPYRFRIAAFNEHGTVFSSERVAYTRASVDEPVWRLQLGVKVGNIEDANMDDSLKVSLNAGSSFEIPFGNGTWLDYGRDDFERGSDFIYDLNIDAISQRSDITRITLAHAGSDAVCIENIRLYVNGVEVFDRTFNQSGVCKWLDNNDSHTITYDQLRTHPKWQAYQTPFPPLTIRRGELESRVESMIGHMIHDQDVYWGDRDGRAYVEASMKDASTMHMTLDLKADANNLPDPEVDISFDLAIAVGCDSATDQVVLAVTTENFNANVSLGILGSIIDIFTPIPVGLGLPCEGGLMSCLERYIERQIESRFEPISINISADAPICELGFEPTVEVVQGGDIVLGFRQPSGVPMVFNGDLIANPNIPILTPVITFAATDFDAPDGGNEGGNLPSNGPDETPEDVGDVVSNDPVTTEGSTTTDPTSDTPTTDTDVDANGNDNTDSGTDVEDPGTEDVDNQNQNEDENAN